MKTRWYRLAVLALWLTAMSWLAIRKIIGDNEIKKIAEERVMAYEEEGWKFGFDMSLGNHFLRAISPNGEEVNGDALFEDSVVEETFLSLATLNTEGEKRDMFTSNLAQRVSEYFWYDWRCGSGSAINFDYMVEVELGSSVHKMWFPDESDAASPDGAIPSSGNRFLDAFDARGKHFWNNLLEVASFRTIAYQNGEEKEARTWRKIDDHGYIVPDCRWFAANRESR